MKFKIERASDWSSETCPCEGATPNKRVGHMFPDYWTIDINSIEELIALRDKVGYPLIIENTIEEDTKLQSITIYDSYIE